MSDATIPQAEQANQLPPCDPEVFSNGVSIGLFEMPKEKAESLCEALRQATGYKIDWHYLAGRAHIKALPAEQEDSEISRAKAACIESMCRAYQAEARYERANKEKGILTAALLKTGCLVIPHGSFFLEDVPKIIARELQDAEAENERLRASKAEAITTAEAATDDAERLRANLEPAYFIRVREKTLVCRNCGNAHFHPSRRKSGDHVCNSCGTLLFKEEIDLMVHADEEPCVSTPCPICGKHGHIGDCEGD